MFLSTSSTSVPVVNTYINRGRPLTSQPAQQSRGARVGLQRLVEREVLKCAGHLHDNLERGSNIFLVSKDEFYIRLFEITVSNLGMWFKKKKKEDG